MTARRVVAACLLAVCGFPPVATAADPSVAGAVSSPQERLASGQDTTAPPAPVRAAAPSSARQGVGFTAGLVSGLGFAYRRHFVNGFGMQIAGSGWASREDSFVSLGAEAIRTISRSERTQLYWVAGTSLFRNSNQYYDYNACYPVMQAAPICVPPQTQRVTGSVNIGAGIGLEFTGKRIGVSLEVPVSLMLDIEEGRRFERKGVYPIPGVSLIYYF